MKICYIATDWSGSKYKRETGEYGGVGYYRVYKPAEYLRKIGHEVDVWGKDFADALGETSVEELFQTYRNFFASQQYDIVITKQIDTANVTRLISACKSLDLPIVMDIDDNFLEVPYGNPALDNFYTKDGIKRAYSASALSMMDSIFVSTKPLKDYFENYLKKTFNIDIPIYILPNLCEQSEWKQNKTSKNYIKIGWQGSITHDEDLKIALPALKEILNERKNVELELIGGIRQDKIKELFKDWGDEVNRVTLGYGVPAWNGFPELLGSRNIDIGIAPLVDNEFNRGKSHIKWMEYGILGIPCVASNVYPYYEDILHLKTIKENETGLLAKDTDEFKEKILYLIDNPKEIERIGKNVRKHIRDNWSFKKNIYLWDKAIKSVVQGE